MNGNARERDALEHPLHLRPEPPTEDGRATETANEIYKETFVNRLAFSHLMSLRFDSIARSVSLRLRAVCAREVARSRSPIVRNRF